MTYYNVVSKPRWADMDSDDEDPQQVLVNRDSDEVLNQESFIDHVAENRVTDEVLINTDSAEVLNQASPAAEQQPSLNASSHVVVLVNTDTEEVMNQEPAETFQEMEQPILAPVVFVPIMHWAESLLWYSAYENHCKCLVISGHNIALIFHKQQVLKNLVRRMTPYQPQNFRHKSHWEKDFLKKLCEEWKDLFCYEMSQFRLTQYYDWNDIRSEQTKDLLQEWKSSFLKEISEVCRTQSYYNNRPQSLQDAVQVHGIFNQVFKSTRTDFESIEVKPGPESLCKEFLKEFISQRAVDYVHYGISNVSPLTASFGDDDMAIIQKSFARAMFVVCPVDWNKLVVHIAMKYKQSSQYQQWFQATNGYHQPQPPQWQQWQQPQREPVEQGRPLRPGLQALPLTPGPVQ